MFEDFLERRQQLQAGLARLAVKGVERSCEPGHDCRFALFALEHGLGPPRALEEVERDRRLIRESLARLTEGLSGG